MKKYYILIILFFSVILLFGCAANYSGDLSQNDAQYYKAVPNENNESYLEITENDFISVLDDPVSTFSLDTSTAGYTNIRRMIRGHSVIPKNSVKLEEMINYFKYDYEEPVNDEALHTQAEMMECPWNPEHKIFSIGIKAKEIENTGTKVNNLVFLLDVSGSMAAANKLPLMQTAFKMFSETLGPNDIVSIVTYASSDRVVLEGTTGIDKKLIVNAIEDLSAGGSTAGAAGINTAYQIAQKYFVEGGNNRVLLGTDGDFNVGISSPEDLKDFISEKRNQGIYLSIYGFGYGNLKDDRLETLASNGDAEYSYIDDVTEARKALVEDIGGTLNIVAKDTKTQVTFNPKYISEYRLLGYENKLLTDEEFDDENADAGEIGAGHVVTAVYEVVMNSQPGIETTLGTDYVKVAIRYKDPDTAENKEIISLFNGSTERNEPTEDLIFISCVIEFGLLLRNSEYKHNASYAAIISRLNELDSVQSDPYRKEFLDLVNTVQSN